MTYDGRDRLTGTGSCSFGAVTCWFHYDYDVLDNLTRVQGADGSDRYYCYDTRWQLTNIKTGGCNGTSVVGLGYDERGNLANKNGVQYLFDVGNRLRLVDGVEYYRYDGLGRRAYAASPTLGAIFSQYSRSGQLMYQHNGRNQKSSEYVYLNGSLVAIRETPFSGGTSTLKYQHTDALGTPVAVTDSAGSVIERSEYTPYGQLFNRPLTDGPGYTGHVQDAATGLTYMQQRYYDPTIGRFLSMDPVTADANTGGNFNRYWYGNNNPYRFKDPDGREAACVTLRVNCFDSGGTFAQKAIALGAFGGLLIGGFTGPGIVAAVSQQVARYGVAGATLANADKINAAAIVTAEAVAGTSLGANPANISRALTQADLGIKGTIHELKGTFTVADGVATARIDMIRADIKNPLSVIQNLASTAERSGATTLRIEGTVANEKLFNALEKRYGLKSDGAIDSITIQLEQK